MELEPREILFRGREYDSLKWVYGYYFKGNNGESYIISIIKNNLGTTDTIRVKDETVTQYTGLNDSTTWDDLTEKERGKFMQDWGISTKWDGKRIFGGDILEHAGLMGYVYFEDGMFQLKKALHGHSMSGPLEKNAGRIVGNIWDN